MDTIFSMPRRSSARHVMIPGVARRDLDAVTRAMEGIEAAREELIRAILRARESGETYRDIGAAAGLTHGRIVQIVHEYEEREQRGST